MTEIPDRPSDADFEREEGEGLFFLMLILLTGTFLAWAAVGEVDVLSMASGEVIPLGKVKHLQHLEGGIVKEILVKEGDRIRVDQPLVRLDEVDRLSEAEELGYRIQSLSVKAIRLRVEAEGGEALIFDESQKKNATSQVEEETETFLARKSRLSSQVLVQESLIHQRRFEMEEMEARMVSQKEMLVQVEDQVDISGKLLLQSLSNRLTHTERLKDRARIRGEIGELKARLLRLGASLNEEQARQEGIQAAFREEARMALGETLRSRNELEERQKKLKDALERTVMRSPVDGVIKSLNLFARGQVVKPGETVLEIVPTGERLLIEAQLPAGEIGFVRVGQEAWLKLESGYASRVDKLMGRVIHVSPDSMITSQGVAYYRVLIEANANHFTDRDLFVDLFPGMKIHCSIRTGQRTILEYLLDPFFKISNQALTER